MTFRSRYECPYHRRALVKEVITVSAFGRACGGPRVVSFYRCPYTYPTKVRRIMPLHSLPDALLGTDQRLSAVARVDSEGRCLFMRPDKWQRRADV